MSDAGIRISNSHNRIRIYERLSRNQPEIFSESKLWTPKVPRIKVGFGPKKLAMLRFSGKISIRTISVLVVCFIVVNREISWDTYAVQETKRSFVNGENEIEVIEELSPKDSFRVIFLK